jgi:ABC-type multidrug transport system ATPase subunit
LTTLAGKAYYGALTGHVYLNGEPRSISEFKKIVGFVPQEDIMLRSMTVEEVLLTSALLRLPTSWTYMEKKRMVNSIIDLMGLQDVRDSRIGDETKRGISGGQRKRVNIGMELVADPTILFLDEPTSGLDSSSSREVCGLLRKVAQLGLTFVSFFCSHFTLSKRMTILLSLFLFSVVTVIHQPRYEIFTMFHDVLLLGKGGRTVYIGPSERALEYFESMGFPLPDAVNPPDFFMDIIAGSVEPKTDPLGYWRETDFTPELLFDVWESRAAEYSKTSAFDSSVVEADKAAAINRTDLAASLFEDGEDSDRPLPPVVLKSREKQATSRSTAGFFTFVYVVAYNHESTKLN